MHALALLECAQARVPGRSKKASHVDTGREEPGVCRLYRKDVLMQYIWSMLVRDRSHSDLCRDYHLVAADHLPPAYLYIR